MIAAIKKYLCYVWDNHALRYHSADYCKPPCWYAYCWCGDRMRYINDADDVSFMLGDKGKQAWFRTRHAELRGTKKAS